MGSLTMVLLSLQKNKVVSSQFIPWPIEIKFCKPTIYTNQTKSPPSVRYWFRARGKLSDDQALHRCVVAYALDLIFLGVILNPHRGRGLQATSVSLDHSMWFHRPLRADDWLLFVITTPTAYNAHGFVSGQMFNKKGEAPHRPVQLAIEGSTAMSFTATLPELPAEITKVAKAANPKSQTKASGICI